MSFVALHENLRREIRKRIESGELTGMELARRTGFAGAHLQLPQQEARPEALRAG